MAFSKSFKEVARLSKEFAEEIGAAKVETEPDIYLEYPDYYILTPPNCLGNSEG